MGYNYNNYPEDNAKHNYCHGEGTFSIRHVLADGILNFQIPQGLATILVTFLTVYITWKLFKLSLRLVVSMIWPLLIFATIIIALPVLYNFKACVDHSGFYKCTINGLNGLLSQAELIFAFIQHKLEIMITDITSNTK